MSQVVKPKGSKVTALEKSIVKAIREIQSTEITQVINDLTISAVKEIQINNNKKAYIIFVPFREHKKFQKIQHKLITEIEKKFPNTHVVIIAQRTILSDNMSRWTNQKLSHSRTLVAVQEAILNDIVYPSKIVGKRTRYNTDGSQLLKVFVDKNDAKDIEEKLTTFMVVYKRLTSRAVEFKLQ